MGRLEKTSRLTGQLGKKKFEFEFNFFFFSQFEPDYQVGSAFAASSYSQLGPKLKAGKRGPKREINIKFQTLQLVG